MAKFFVGQRVRLVGKWEHPEDPLPGDEGRIVGVGGVGKKTKRKFDWSVHVDGASYFVQADSHELEPIQYDGMKPSTWDQCEWQPEEAIA